MLSLKIPYNSTKLQKKFCTLLAKFTILLYNRLEI